jgi:cell division protein ZapA
MTTTGGQSVTVEIFGQTYKLRGVRDRQALERLASYVDGKMASIAEQTKATDTLKMAILAALNIADEYFQAVERSAEPQGLETVEAKIEEITLILDSCLED